MNKEESLEVLTRGTDEIEINVLYDEFDGRLWKRRKNHLRRYV